MYSFRITSINLTDSYVKIIFTSNNNIFIKINSLLGYYLISFNDKIVKKINYPKVYSRCYNFNLWLLKNGMIKLELLDKKIINFKINSEFKGIQTSKDIDYYTLPFIINPNIKLSFCITCKDRLYQLKNTLPINLIHNKNSRNIIEFILVDFDTPNLREWIYSNFGKELASGYLKYYYTDKLSNWHASLCKNIAHVYASGVIVSNLDCDNYTGNNGGLHIIKNFKSNNILFHQWSGYQKDGSYGRISMLKSVFMHLNGYDQSLLPMGYQDHDIILRFIYVYGAINYKKYAKNSIEIKKYSRAIKNDKSKSISNLDKKYDKLSWESMNKINKIISRNRITRGIYRANSGKKIGVI